MQSLVEAIQEMAEQASRRQGPSDLAEKTYDCDLCRDTSFEVVLGRGARPCPVCAEAKRRQRLLDRPEFDRYREITLENLTPMPERHFKQEAIINRAKQDPEASFALFGLNQIGKTCICYAIYKHAINSGRSGVATSAGLLLDQLTAMELDDQARPGVTAPVLLNAKERWCVFIDDLTVLPRFSPFAVNQFYKIFNAVVQRRHQLLVTAHATESEIEAAFNQGGVNMGASIVGRIRAADRMIVPSGLMKMENA